MELHSNRLEVEAFVLLQLEKIESVSIKQGPTLLKTCATNPTDPLGNERTNTQKK